MEKYTQPISEAQTSSIIPSPLGQRMSAAEKRAKQQYIEQWVISTQKYMGLYPAGGSNTKRKPNVTREESRPEHSSHGKSTLTTVRKSVSTSEGSREQYSNECNATSGTSSDSAVKSILKRLHGLKTS